MPLYEYACRDCGHRFDELRRMAERLQAPPCPVCGSERTELALSAPAVFGAGGGSAPGNHGSSGNCFSGG